jgi:hypothetical protein
MIPKTRKLMKKVAMAKLMIEVGNIGREPQAPDLQGKAWTCA